MNCASMIADRSSTRTAPRFYLKPERDELIW